MIKSYGVWNYIHCNKGIKAQEIKTKTIENAGTQKTNGVYEFFYKGKDEDGRYVDYYYK